MDLKRIKARLEPVIGKYKYAILILVTGIVLMMLPGKVTETSEVRSSVSVTADSGVDTKTELEGILSCIAGAGEVRVMLKEGTGTETVYQTDEDHTASDTSSSTRTDVVTVTDSSRGETGLIRQINPPRYMGVIIVCQGADDPAVKLAIADAVSKITGLGTDKIAILKMK